MAKGLGANSQIMINIDSPAIFISGPITIPLLVSSIHLTGSGQELAINSDMQSQTPIPSIPYANAPYGVTGTPGVISWDGNLKGATIASKATKNGSGVVLDSAGGTIDLTVVTPATDTSSGSPVPDPKASYTGTWQIVSNTDSVVSISG